MRILLAEDDLESATLLGSRLSGVGHEVLHAPDGRQALELALTSDADVIVLDRMLPGLDGLEVLAALRSSGIDAPVLMLTALGRIEDRVEGLDAGADDYLVKPFAFSELAARINALFRRRAEPADTLLVAGSIRLDLLKRRVTRAGQEVSLQPREFGLLEALVRHAGKVVTRTMLLESVWNFHFDPQTNIVETHMSRMRSKLNQGFADDPVETVRGEGYRMRTDV